MIDVKDRFTGFDWSANVDRLKSSVGQRLTATRIAEPLGGGVTRNAVIGKVHRLGLSLAGARRGGLRAADRGEARSTGRRNDAGVDRLADRQARVVGRSPHASSVLAKLTTRPERGASRTKSKTAAPTVVVWRSPAIAPELAPPLTPTSAPTGVTIQELRDGMCRFLLRKLGPSEHRYCGETCEVSRSFCAEHHAIVYRPSKDGERGASNARPDRFIGMACAAVLALAAASLCRPAQAQDASLGCKVLLCAAASNPSWPSIPYCVPVMQQLFSRIAKGGGWPGCPEAGTSASNVGYQPYQDCAAGSTAVSVPSGQSSYASDPNGTSCATTRDFQNYQTQLDAYNRTLAAQNGSAPQAPSLQTTARAANPNPYYVDLNTGGTSLGPSRFYFSLTTH